MSVEYLRKEGDHLNKRKKSKIQKKLNYKTQLIEDSSSTSIVATANMFETEFDKSYEINSRKNLTKRDEIVYSFFANVGNDPITFKEL